jgi:hypothetical protein
MFFSMSAVTQMPSHCSDILHGLKLKDTNLSRQYFGNAIEILFLEGGSTHIGNSGWTRSCSSSIILPFDATLQCGAGSTATHNPTAQDRFSWQWHQMHASFGRALLPTGQTGCVYML